MTTGFDNYIRVGKSLASSHGLTWDLRVDEFGTVAPDSRWNLTELTKVMPPPIRWLSDLSVRTPSLPFLNILREKKGLPTIQPVPMSPAWKDLALAVVMEHVFIRGNTAGQAWKMVEGVRQLAAASPGLAPWQIDAEIVKDAYCAALLAAQSGKRANDLRTTLKVVWDHNMLHDGAPLHAFCQARGTPELEVAEATATYLRKREAGSGAERKILGDLQERRAPEKLPSPQVLHEFARIALASKAMNFSDAIRISAWRIKLFTPMRVGEAVRLPLDCIKTHEYFDADGSLAGEKGGISKSLELRHFMEKSSHADTTKGKGLVEKRMFIPVGDEETILGAYETARRLTAPLRRTLKHQTETGRMLPFFQPDAQVPAWEIYLALSGNVQFTSAELPQNLIDSYRENFDPRFIDRMVAAQLSSGAAHDTLGQYFNRHCRNGLPIRNARGQRIGEGPRDRIDWKNAFMQVDEVEDYFRRHVPTKSSEVTPGQYQDGEKAYTYDQLFLMPIRNVVEGRNGRILDVTRYSAVGTLSVFDLHLTVSNNNASLFNRYADEFMPEAMSMRTHTTRHLMTTELLRGGVSDSIVAKHANREHEEVNRVYDHRTLEELFADSGLGDQKAELADKAAGMAVRLIRANLARGPIVKEFNEVQKTRGDAAALEFLAARAPGFHSTPWGFCVANFAVEPCPKSLQCLKDDGCRDLVRTESTAEIDNINRHLHRTKRGIEVLEAIPKSKRGPGWQSSMNEGLKMVENFERALVAKTGERPFAKAGSKFRPIGGDTVLD